MSLFYKRHNSAVEVNPPILQGQLADIHITEHGSDWLWAAFAVFSVATIAFIGLGFSKPATDRVFHYITAGITLVAAITYFSLASDLGFVPIPVEFHRTNRHVLGEFRQVFYVRYIDWFITSPLILLEILLTASLPWPQVLFTVLLSWTMVVTRLLAALTPTRYKWGYFTFGVAAMLYIFYTLLFQTRRHATALGSDVNRTYSNVAIYTIFLWTLYQIAFGLSEGGNVISPDGEAAFYGVLDILTMVGFGALLLLGHRDIDPARLGLRIRNYDDEVTGTHHTGFGGHSDKAVDNGVGRGTAAV